MENSFVEALYRYWPDINWQRVRNRPGTPDDERTYQGLLGDRITLFSIGKHATVSPIGGSLDAPVLTWREINEEVEHMREHVIKP